MKTETTVDKRIFKKSTEELQLYMHFKKRGFKAVNKKLYTRKQRKALNYLDYFKD